MGVEPLPAVGGLGIRLVRIRRLVRGEPAVFEGDEAVAHGAEGAPGGPAVRECCGGLAGSTGAGASGGVGHLAVQIAKRCLGAALVVGVCSSRNEDFVRRCGADEVVAYDRVPVEGIASSHPEWKGSFDLIFDAVGIDRAWTVLAPWLLRQDGRFVGAALPQLPDGRAGEDVGLIGGLATAARLGLRRMGGRYRFIYGFMGDLPSKQGFPSLVEWIAEGKLAPRLAATYSLDQLADAHRASETGRIVGKISVVIP